MSDEFRVHNFYNYTLEELPAVKDEFDGLYQSALHFKEAQIDLSKLCKSCWLKKYDEQHGGHDVEDEKIYELAEDHWKKQEKNNGH
jgi:hypothetical protein